MRKAIKLVSGIIILLILLFIITIIVLTNVVNPNDYKQRIDKYVFEQTGRHLVIGNVGWSFIPWLGVDLKNVSFANPDNFKGPNLATIGEVKIKVRFLPLLTGSVRLGKVVVNNADINLITSPAGKNNYSDWNKKKPTNKTNQAKPGNNTIPLPVREIHIAGISITHSTIKMTDQKANTKTELSNFNLTTGAIDNTKDFPVNVKFTLQQSDSKNKTNVTAKAITNLNARQQVYQFRRIIINTKTNRPNLPTLPASLKGNIAINVPQETLTVSPLAAQIATMKIQGQIKVQQLLQTPQISVNIRSTETHLQPFMTTLLGKSMLKGTLSFDSALTTSGTSKKTLIANLNGKGKVNVSSGSITGFNLNNLLAMANALLHQQSAPHGDSAKITSFSSLSGTYVINQGILRNNDLQLSAGQASAKGAGAVNLNNTTINYLLTAEYKTKQGAKPQFELPIMVNGPLNHPSIKPNYSRIAKQVITNTIKNKIKDYVGQSGKHLNLNNLLKNL